MNDLRLRVDNLGQTQIFHEIENLIHFGIDPGGFIAHDGKPDFRPFIHVIGPNLGNRCVELVPNFRDSGFDHLAFGLEAVAIMNVQYDIAHTDYHPKTSFKDQDSFL
jgi:hypothetical protein